MALYLLVSTIRQARGEELCTAWHKVRQNCTNISSDLVRSQYQYRHQRRSSSEKVQVTLCTVQHVHGGREMVQKILIVTAGKQIEISKRQTDDTWH